MCSRIGRAEEDGGMASVNGRSLDSPAGSRRGPFYAAALLPVAAKLMLEVEVAVPSLLGI